MNTMAAEETKSSNKKQKTLSSNSPTSFLSLPYDLTLNCLARTSRTHAPILSLVSKTFQSIFTSHDLEATRSHIGKKPEKCLYVCLNLKNPTWFVLSTSPTKKLIPLPLFPYKQHPNSSTVISNGSNIYLIGGCFEGKKKRTRRVFVLDCKSHQWRQLPNMRVSRKEPSARVVDGKICVSGGCSKRYDDKDVYEEIYDTMTQSWEPINPTTRSNIQESTYGLVPDIYHYMTTLGLYPKACLGLVKNKKDWFSTSICNGKLYYASDATTPWWSPVSGLEELSSSNLHSVVNPSGGSRVIVWWKKAHFSNEPCVKTEIWCAMIRLQRYPVLEDFRDSLNGQSVCLPSRDVFLI